MASARRIVQADGRVEESIRQVQAFQHVRATKGAEACPSGWEPGKPTLKPGPDLVGKGVLFECLDHPDVGSVLVVGRSGCGVVHEKLEQVIHDDFFDYFAHSASATVSWPAVSCAVSAGVSPPVSAVSPGSSVAVSSPPPPPPQPYDMRMNASSDALDFMPPS